MKTLSKLMIIVCILCIGIMIHNTGYAFPRGLFDGLNNLIVRGEGDLTDICGVLFIPCVVIFVLTKRLGLRLVTGFIWFIDLLIDPLFLLHHIIATLILVGLTVLLRWAIQRTKKAPANE